MSKKVFFEISIGGAAAGRIEFQLVNLKWYSLILTFIYFIVHRQSSKDCWELQVFFHLTVMITTTTTTTTPKGPLHWRERVRIQELVFPPSDPWVYASRYTMIPYAIITNRRRWFHQPQWHWGQINLRRKVCR